MPLMILSSISSTTVIIRAFALYACWNVIMFVISSSSDTELIEARLFETVSLIVSELVASLDACSPFTPNWPMIDS